MTRADDVIGTRRVTELPQLANELKATVLGLHPHALGDPRAPDAADLAAAQFRMLLRAEDRR